MVACANRLRGLIHGVAGVLLSGVDGDNIEAHEVELLALYCAELGRAGLHETNIPSPAALAAALDLAYVDLYRWMLGWGVWGNRFLVRRAERVLDRIDGGVLLCDELAYDAAVRIAFP